MFIEKLTIDQLAIIVAKLVEKGLTFRARETSIDLWTIELTGGY